MPERDYVQEHIDRRNREGAAKPNPLLPNVPAPEAEPEDLTGDPVARHIRRLQRARDRRPNPLLPARSTMK
jgi:hypothetical protein